MTTWQPIVFSVCSAGLLVMLGALSWWLLHLKNQTAFTTSLSKLIEILKAQVAHAISELKPEVAKAYEDGTMSAEEWKVIKDKIIALAIASVPDGLKSILGALGVDTKSPNNFLSGVVEQIVDSPPRP